MTREERERLYNENQGLVPFAVRKVVKRAPDEDLLQEGKVALWMATGHFDPSLGYEFSTFATVFIKNEIKKYLTRRSKMIRVPDHRAMKREYQVPVTLECDMERGQFSQETSVFDVTMSNEAAERQFEDATLVISLRQIAGTRAPKGIDELIEYAVRGKSQTDMAEESGVKKQAIGRRVTEARRRLRSNPIVREWAGV